LNAHRFRRLKEEQREFIYDANFKHAVKISRQRAATEEARRLFMAAERQKLIELNAQHHADTFAREQTRLTQTRHLSDGWHR
jgi:hypothetical protein